MTSHKPRLWDIEGAGIWQLFSDIPGEITQLKTFWVKWALRKDTVHPKWGYKTTYAVTFYSKDFGCNWHEWDWYDRDDSVYVALKKEAEEAKIEFLKARTKELARRRKEKIKKFAKKHGITENDAALLLKKKKQKKLEANKQKKVAVSMANNTNRKMKIGAAIKPLLEVAEELQKKLLDGTELQLQYVESRIHKIDEATEILSSWLKPRKKK